MSKNRAKPIVAGPIRRRFTSFGKTEDPEWPLLLDKAKDGYYLEGLSNDPRTLPGVLCKKRESIPYPFCFMETGQAEPKRFPFAWMARLYCDLFFRPIYVLPSNHWNVIQMSGGMAFRVFERDVFGHWRKRTGGEQ